MSLKASIQLNQLKSVHIIGVGGTLMGAFAAFLKRQGIRVTGSDGPLYPPMSDVLKNTGVEVFEGYVANRLLEINPDLVVVGNVVRSDNPEARFALDSVSPAFQVTSLPEAMEKLMLSHTNNCVVAGTHGKTTTSTLLAHTLVECGLNPSYFIGGVPKNLPFSFHVQAQNGPFVLEGDEYDTAFWDKVPKFNHYLPDQTILTSVEFDHADIYADLAAVERAFEGLLTRIRPGGSLIACTEYTSINSLLKKNLLDPKLPVYTYARTSETARFWVHSVESFDTNEGGGNDAKIRFQIKDQKENKSIILNLPMAGEHNALNAAAVWILAHFQLGLSSESIQKAFLSFEGVKRRQEVRGEKRGVSVIDDFAHHPTAVKETLRALKKKYVGRKLIAVFEPRSATSRRKIFQKDYVEAFLEADSIFIASPFDVSKIPQDQQFSSDQLVADLVAKGKAAQVFIEIESGVQKVAKNSHSGDVVAVLSNGGFGGFIPKLLDSL